MRRALLLALLPLAACFPRAAITDSERERISHELDGQQRYLRVAAYAGPLWGDRSRVFVSELPRTRNQKVMRRVIRGVLTGMPLGDLSSLANPESIESLRSGIVFASEASSEPAPGPAAIPG